MTNNLRYPKLHLRSKNELAKRLAGKNGSREEMLNLINYCLENHDSLWRDYQEMSDPLKNKWTRNASGTELGKLLKLIDRKILKPYDKMLPSIIHGGISCKNTKSAASALLGKKRRRTLLKMDMSRFYEHISDDRVVETLKTKMACDKSVAKILALLCCVPEGPKEKPSNHLTLARGFATSGRLAIWCNLDLFLRIFWAASKSLKGHDPKMAIYVDDIGITASRIAPEIMGKLFVTISGEIKSRGQGLELNTKKTKIVDYLDNKYKIDGIKNGKAKFEFLGIELGRNSLRANAKVRCAIVDLKQQSQKTSKNRKRLKGLRRYSAYLER